ncbi:hypothetical protein HanPI659440_Chr03g0101701 [Helianthus annuus]|nr:hypothetical protein HanPI659440_Chr03g0101701 [Helianthus annuus]
MVTPSKPTSPSPTQPTPPSSPTAEEEPEVVPVGKLLLALKWKYTDFQILMTKIQMPEAYGAMFPQVGDTAGDALAGMVIMFSDFFGICNIRPPLTVFMVDLLESYNIHISQLSPLGMVRARHFEYCFRSQNLEPLVEDFQQFYQLHVMLGFYSFYLRKTAPKIMPVLPKGLTK